MDQVLSATKKCPLDSWFWGPLTNNWSTRFSKPIRKKHWSICWRHGHQEYEWCSLVTRRWGNPQNIREMVNEAKYSQMYIHGGRRTIPRVLYYERRNTTKPKQGKRSSGNQSPKKHKRNARTEWKNSSTWALHLKVIWESHAKDLNTKGMCW